MLATQCSRPMAAKALIGSQMPMNLLPSVLALVASHSAMHTSQLHMIARMKACTHDEAHLCLVDACPKVCNSPFHGSMCMLKLQAISA